jgi:hypothetical protein
MGKRKSVGKNCYVFCECVAKNMEWNLKQRSEVVWCRGIKKGNDFWFCLKKIGKVSKNKDER